ncbi:MAG TPA: PEP-CTERM sorting domain-containing protein [Myxococcales bacterium]|nr:PEP-CTERM sorting domain-containing protein [Myxococcales bacterium]
MIVLGQFTFSAIALPEPSTGLLLGLGLATWLRLSTRYRS